MADLSEGVFSMTTREIQVIRLNRIFKLFAVCMLIVSLLAGSSFAAATASDSARKQEIIDLIVGYHVSGIERSDLNVDSIDTIISSLNDPYSEYFSPEGWQVFKNSLENNYTGVGIRVGFSENRFYVNEVFAGTPAAEAGMLDGDYIIGVNGESVTGLTIEELVTRITGDEGTDVLITIERDGRQLELPMKRKSIHIPAIKSGLFDAGIGYIRVSSFSSDADELFSSAVDELKEQGMTSLILDLRDNPGGLLDTAANMAKRFIRNGNLIHTKDRSNRTVPYAIKGERTIDIPVTVLVNEFSASASEVLAGALQDYQIARLVGSKTFGKGSVQSLFELSDGSVLKLTVQEYLTPHKRPVNHVGLIPDIQVTGDAPQLITALQHAGDIDVTVELNRQGMLVNGVAVSDMFRVIREKNMTYVPSRVLAALVEGEAAWNASNRSVIIRTKDSEKEFLAHSEGVKVVNGYSYIALNRFQTQFQHFSWTDRNGQLVLRENGR